VLTQLYIEALLVDEELGDQVWQLCYDGEIDDQVAAIRSEADITPTVVTDELRACKNRSITGRRHYFNSD